MTELELLKLREAIDIAEYEGGWAEYAVWCGGQADTGSFDLDVAIEELYRANELVHLIANRLALRYDLDLLGDNHD